MFKFIRPSNAQIPAWAVETDVPAEAPILADQTIGNQKWVLTWKVFLPQTLAYEPPEDLSYHPLYLQLSQ